MLHKDAFERVKELVNALSVDENVAFDVAGHLYCGRLAEVLELCQDEKQLAAAVAFLLDYLVQYRGVDPELFDRYRKLIGAVSEANARQPRGPEAKA